VKGQIIPPEKIRENEGLKIGDLSERRAKND
jgi:bifunctional DNA-binding transcriptional regulator/antitoxin component of YhaV-PrlF toxin-antitoxin module